MLAGDASAVEARQYSACSDAEKPALSFALSEEQNVEEFRKQFGLSDEELDVVLAAIRGENEPYSGFRARAGG